MGEMETMKKLAKAILALLALVLGGGAAFQLG